MVDERQIPLPDLAHVDESKVVGNTIPDCFLVALEICVTIGVRISFQQPVGHRVSFTLIKRDTRSSSIGRTHNIRAIIFCQSVPSSGVTEVTGQSSCDSRVAEPISRPGKATSHCHACTAEGGLQLRPCGSATAGQVF